MNSILLSIFALILIAAALITKKSSNYKANTFLACAAICLACVLIYAAIDKTITMPHFLVHSDLILFYCTCPLLYIYVAFTTGPISGFQLKHAIHLLAVIPGMGNYMYYQLHGHVKEGDVTDLTSGSITAIIIHLMGLIILLVYLVQSFRLIYAYNQKVKNSQYAPERHQIIWLKTLFPLFMIPFFIQFLSVAGLPVSEVTGRVINTMCFLMFSLLLLRQVHFSTYIFNIELNNTAEYAHKQEEATSPEKLERYKQSLKLIMEDNKAFLIPGLSNGAVAKQLNISQRQLSHVIKEISGKNFPSYMNSLRINFALALFEDPKKASWSSTCFAHECGFNNRENFSKVFKDIVGTSFEDYQHKMLVKHGKLGN